MCTKPTEESMERCAWLFRRNTILDPLDIIIKSESIEEIRKMFFYNTWCKNLERYERQWEMLAMRYRDDMTYREIGERFGVTPTYIRQQIKKASYRIHKIARFKGIE